MSTPTAVRAARQYAAAQTAYDDRAEPDEPESFTSLQPLGDTEVMVDYCLNDSRAQINGIWLNAEFVEADCFAPYVIDRWRSAIEGECDSGLMGLYDEVSA